MCLIKSPQQVYEISIIIAQFTAEDKLLTNDYKGPQVTGASGSVPSLFRVLKHDPFWSGELPGNLLIFKALILIQSIFMVYLAL